MTSPKACLPLPQHVHPARGAGLLPLEPGAQAGRVEDVVAGQLLAALDHLVATDDAHVVGRLEVFSCSVWVAVSGMRE